MLAIEGASVANLALRPPRALTPFDSANILFLLSYHAGVAAIRWALVFKPSVPCAFSLSYHFELHAPEPECEP